MAIGMQRTITIKKALILLLDDIEQPIVRQYDLGKYFYKLFHSGNYKSSIIKLARTKLHNKTLARFIKEFANNGLLQPRANQLFSIFGKPKISIEEILCYIDPFAYLSYLSAMRFHGLSSYNSRTIYLCSPKSDSWKILAIEQMKKDLGDLFEQYHISNLPKLVKFQPKIIDENLISWHTGLVLGKPLSVANSKVRVSTIGRTFLDMLKNPAYCGGMPHVVEVYQIHAKVYLNAIVDEIDKYGSQVDKVRAGYLLEECNLQHEKINAWQQKYVQRGGSRKLDPENKFSSIFSERWCLSLNVD